jgi:hypothetical protein
VRREYHLRADARQVAPEHTVKERRSKLDMLSRSLNRVAIVLLLAFVVSAIGAIDYVANEFPDASIWRYFAAIADAGTFLVAAVMAWVGSAVIQALGRVRTSLLEAMIASRREPEREFERPVGW